MPSSHRGSFLGKKMIVIDSVRYTFKHKILSLEGFHPDYKKTNQDYSKVHHFLSNKELTRLFFLADGHGKDGHEASKMATEFLCKYLEKEISEKPEVELNEETIKDIIFKGFDEVQKVLEKERDLDFKYSGTTMVLVIYRKCSIFFVNLGDSRGFLASKCGIKVVPSLVTEFHKPDDEIERKRIELSGGVIAPFFDEKGVASGPNRVWNKKQTEPGLATSRSFGDLLAHKLGVSHVPGILKLPDIIVKKLDSNDHYLFLASDGVWDVLTPKEIIEKCDPFYPTLNVESAAKKVLSESASKWSDVTKNNKRLNKEMTSQF